MASGEAQHLPDPVIATRGPIETWADVVVYAEGWRVHEPMTRTPMWVEMARGSGVPVEHDARGRALAWDGEHPLAVLCNARGDVWARRAHLRVLLTTMENAFPPLANVRELPAEQVDAALWYLIVQHYEPEDENAESVPLLRIDRLDGVPGGAPTGEAERLLAEHGYRVTELWDGDITSLGPIHTARVEPT